jgi:hypothetical protein
MNSHLSFRKESIQRASQASAKLSNLSAGSPDTKGARPEREKDQPVTTTTVTYTTFP